MGAIARVNHDVVMSGGPRVNYNGSMGASAWVNHDDSMGGNTTRVSNANRCVDITFQGMDSMATAVNAVQHQVCSKNRLMVLN